MKTKKKLGKNLRKSEKSQVKIMEVDGIEKVGTLPGGGGAVADPTEGEKHEIYATVFGNHLL